MYVDHGVSGAFDDTLSWVKKKVEDLAESNPVIKDAVNTFKAGAKVEAEQKIRKYAATSGLGHKLGTEIGCATAAAFEKNIPKFPIFGSEPDLTGCEAPKKAAPKTGASGLGQTAPTFSMEDIVLQALAPAKKEAEKVAEGIAQPRIEARLKPWFIGLPIIGLGVGLGIGWWLWRRKKGRK